MNEIIQSLYARKSVRAYTDRPVPAEVKRTVLAAAVQAPTAGGQQLYTILDITDQRLKDTLAETCDHQPFISTAPVVLIFCADCLRWWDAYAEAGCDPRRPGPGDLMLAVNRRDGRADYLPCIAWGGLARRCGALEVGDGVRIEGRLQSRAYTKVDHGVSEVRTAYEVSVMKLEPVET